MRSLCGAHVAPNGRQWGCHSATLSTPIPPVPRPLACSRRRRARVLAAAHRVAAGPEPPPKPKRVRKPEWVRILEEDASTDPEAARLVEGTGGDPDKIRDNMKREMESTDFLPARSASNSAPLISFRETDPFNLYIWLRFVEPPMDAERELLQNVLRSWYVLARLGGFNAQNMQVSYNHGETNFMNYDNDEATQSMASYIHEMGELQYQDNWARFNVDMGTCDELALDVLLNALIGFSRDHVALTRVFVGGENENWPLPHDKDSVPKVGMNPLRGPVNAGDDLQDLDDMDQVGGLDDVDGFQDLQGPSGKDLLRRAGEKFRREMASGTSHTYSRDEFRRTHAG